MYESTNHYNNQNPRELENVINLIKKNVDCTKDIINRIDIFLENKELPISIMDALVTQRNACAVNVMNFTRVMKFI